VPGGVGGKKDPARRGVVEGSWVIVALCVGLVAIAVLVVARPKLLAHNAVTKALGAPAIPVSTTTTTTTADPASVPAQPTATTVPDPAVTTTTEAPPATTVPDPAVTTTTATPTATTAPPVLSYRAPVIATTVEPGSFGAIAEIVSATYPLTTTGGVVSVTGAWSGAVTLTLSLQCGTGVPDSSTGPSGLSVSTACPAGPVSVGASEAVTATVSYTLTIRYPSGGGS